MTLFKTFLPVSSALISIALGAISTISQTPGQIPGIPKNVINPNFSTDKTKKLPLVRIVSPLADALISSGEDGAALH